MRNLLSVLLLMSLLLSGMCHAKPVTEELTIPAGDQELTVLRYPATGEHLIVWIAPGFGTHERAMATSELLMSQGVEVWHVDLADSLFLTKNTSTMRAMDGRYVARLIDAAHQKTGKRITLLTRSYGALPALKGARQWQILHEKDNANYLSGAMLFSPELYSTVPALGLEPEYDPIAMATNIPIILYQAGKRSNRWQLDALLQHLGNGGSQVFYRIKQGVIGIFYKEDNSPETLIMLQALPKDIVKELSLLRRMPTPKKAAPISVENEATSHGLDTTLKPFMGDPRPLPLDLQTAEGIRIKRDSYAGKVTVVNFWATWCPPCVEEIPSLNNLRQAMRGKPFELISVNYAEKKEEVANFLQMVNVDFPVLLDEDGRVSANWNVLVYPSTFVIGPDGDIEYGVNGAIHWDSAEVIRALSELMQMQP